MRVFGDGKSHAEKLDEKVAKSSVLVAARIQACHDGREDFPWQVEIGKNPFFGFGGSAKQTEDYIRRVWGSAKELIADMALCDEVALNLPATEKASIEAREIRGHLSPRYSRMLTMVFVDAQQDQ